MTPLRRQYLDIKRRYPHAILFFRLGDFYETFDEDAEVVARELEIVLTSRPVSKGERVPLAGIPHHALDSYLAKLIAKGYKVAICEQTEPPAKGKKIVDRQVVRVVTPGTLVEDNLLNAAQNNYLAALVADGAISALAYVDVSTGEFVCLQGTHEAVTAEVERLRPAELLVPPGIEPPQGSAGTFTALSPANANMETAVAGLLAHFEVNTESALGLAGHRAAAWAAGAVLAYVAANQRAVLGHLRRLTPVEPGGCMAIDAGTLRNLEVIEPLNRDPASGPGATLLAVLDHTRTSMGARLLRRWLASPLLDTGAITARQDGVDLFFASAVRRGRARDILARVPDLERIAARIATAAAGTPGPATPRDLLALRRGLEATPPLREVLTDAAIIGGQKVQAEDLLSRIHPLADLQALLQSAIADDPQPGNAIKPGHSAELDGLRSTAGDARRHLAELEARERERTGIRSLKVGYNRVFGYYIEVSKANQDAVPPDYLRKQTLVGGERYTTPELQEHEHRVLHARELEEELAASLLKQVCAQIAAEAGRLLETAAAVGLLDVYASLAEAAARYGYARPIVDDSGEIAITDGRHPVVERLLGEGSFVPNDVRLSSSDQQVILLTGPNMAGKSTYLRQVALIVLMAQAGSFVPAREARIGLADRIASRVGALDDIAAGRSTFMVEMLETAAMLSCATGRSLLIFDEIGRGTSTYDGMAIARAVAEYIHNRPDARTRALFATHYHELTEMADVLPRVHNYNVAVAEERGEVVFLHRILPGGADRSYGVHVARLAGLPRPVLQRAEELLAGLEGTAREGPPAPAPPQLALFGQPDSPLTRDIAAIDPDSMTPLEALTRLYELVRQARNEV
jgi:DNA mismatch repair protein MutS